MNWDGACNGPIVIKREREREREKERERERELERTRERERERLSDISSPLFSRLHA